MTEEQGNVQLYIMAIRPIRPLIILLKPLTIKYSHYVCSSSFKSSELLYICSSGY